MENDTVKEYILLMMGHNLKEIFKMVNIMVKENSFGQMVKRMLAHGRMVSSMEKVSQLGQMENGMKAIIHMERSMGKGHSIGLEQNNMWDNGLEAFKMERGHTRLLKEKLSMVFGQMEIKAQISH